MNNRARGAGDSPLALRLPPAPRARSWLVVLILGLAPQALCCRALRALDAPRITLQQADTYVVGGAGGWSGFALLGARSV
jgi:hypothetical protein